MFGLRRRVVKYNFTATRGFELVHVEKAANQNYFSIPGLRAQWSGQGENRGGGEVTVRFPDGWGNAKY